MKFYGSLKDNHRNILASGTLPITPSPLHTEECEDILIWSTATKCAKVCKDCAEAYSEMA